MTGVMQLMMAGGAGVQSPSVVLSDVKTGAQAFCEIGLLQDGTIFLQGNGSTCVPPNWYLPTSSTIGNGYWCQCIVNSGNPPGNPNVIAPLSSSQAFSLVRNAAGTATGNWTIFIYSDAAGTQLVASFTFNATATWN
jgi:hypothetical protein